MSQPPSAYLMKLLISALVAIAAVALSTASARHTFTGVITDDMCAQTGHAAMRMGPTDAECAIACAVSHGAAYVLREGKNVYTLSDQQTPEKFAGRRVRVAGTLDARTRTIQVDSITAAK